MHQIRMPIDIFERRVKQDYANWRLALPREFLQNGADAYANQVVFSFKEDIIEITNNGRPMSLEKCQNALLTLGGSDKGLDSVGGFGIAKEILYFAWKHWTIRSADYKITGQGCYYEVERNLPFFSGMVSTIFKDPDLNPYSIRNYLQTCQSVDTYVNGELMPKNEKGRRIRDLGWATLHKRNVPSEHLHVRVKGVTMFSYWLNTPYSLILELKGDTKEILTANRDGLKGNYNEELQKIIREIEVNRRSSLRQRDMTVLQMYRGYGNTKVAKPQEATQTVSDVSPSMLSSMPLANSVPTIEEREERMSVPNRPDILIYMDQPKIPKKYQPDHWMKRTKTVMGLWRLVLMQTLIDNEIDHTFGIGIVIQEDVGAMYKKHDNTDYFLLNPHIHKKNLVQELRLRAAHEIAHTFGSDHNEDFIAKMELIQRNTWKSEKTYKKIAKMRNIDLNSTIPRS